MKNKYPSNSITEALKHVKSVHKDTVQHDKYIVVLKDGYMYIMGENANYMDTPLNVTSHHNRINTYFGKSRDYSYIVNSKRINKNKLPIRVKEAIRRRVFTILDI